MKYLLLLLIALLPASSVHAQAYDKWDITPAGNSNPTAFTTFLGKLYFKATNPTNGSELWIYDTPIQPTLLPELNPGPADGHGAGTGSGYIADGPMVVLNNKLYYAADDGTTGVELYMYDGFGAHTNVFDIVKGSAGSFPRYITELGGKLYFSASDTDGHELWVYDLGLDTAIKLADINPGQPSGSPRSLTVFNSKLYFTATDITSGQELYVYDPVTDMTTMVADIYPGSGSGNVQNLLVHGGKLYFSAYDPAYGQELFSYDGTSISRLTDINSGPLSSLFTTGRGGMGVMNNKLVFFAQSNGASNDFKLYTYDISSATAALAFADIKPALNTFFTDYHNKLFFAAVHDTTGAELFSYDGSTVSLELDIANGAAGSSPAEFTLFKDWLYFSANDPAFGVELFRYNDQVVGVQNIAFDGDINVYPNPLRNDLHFDIHLQRAEELQVLVSGIDGKTVYKGIHNCQAGDNRITVDAQHLQTGWYVYRVLSKEGRSYAMGKLVKE